MDPGQAEVTKGSVHPWVPESGSRLGEWRRLVYGVWLGIASLLSMQRLIPILGKRVNNCNLKCLMIKHDFLKI